MKQNNNGIEVILFDLGNTLVFFEGDWNLVSKNAVGALTDFLASKNMINNLEGFHREFLEEMHYFNEIRTKTLREYRAEDILRNFFKQKNIPFTEEVIRQALDEFYTISRQYWFLEDDTVSTLNYLQENKYPLGIVSNARYANDVYFLLDKFNLRDYFELIVVSAEVGMRKPHPEIFEPVFDHWKIPPSHYLMVGDLLEADVEGAIELGMKSVWINKRKHPSLKKSEPPKYQPDFTIRKLSELTQQF